ncbi:unnamed protein product, partial [Polarella glacialis]
EGGISQATLRISGDKVWSKLKYESGVHRVQRVPATERAGRVHTSTATVAIMPEMEFTNEYDNEADVIKQCTLQFCRAGGKGGQNVNKLETACHIVHLPTGIHYFIREERSQLLNKEKAIKYVMAALQNRELEAFNSEESSLRSSQIGTGSRSEKIRTYQTKENRVSDHRINQNFALSAILDGGLEEPIRMLSLMEEQEKLDELQEALAFSDE